jgi:hypothetical protein
MSPINPFAAPRSEGGETEPGPARFTLGTNAACGVCGQALPSSAVLYDEGGDPICQSCLDSTQTSAAHVKVSKRVRNVAYGAPLLGLFSFLYNPLLIVSIAVVLQGLYALGAARERETVKLVGDSIRTMKAAAITGIALGALSALLRLLALVIT